MRARGQLPREGPANQQPSVSDGRLREGHAPKQQLCVGLHEFHTCGLRESLAALMYHAERHQHCYGVMLKSMMSPCGGGNMSYPRECLGLLAFEGDDLLHRLSIISGMRERAMTEKRSAHGRRNNQSGGRKEKFYCRGHATTRTSEYGTEWRKGGWAKAVKVFAPNNSTLQNPPDSRGPKAMIWPPALGR